jgi:hypothetical protein
MRKPSKNVVRVQQPTPKELTDSCLEFLRRKFYNQPGDEKAFYQDRRDLLRWVVLWPASWLNNRGVTIHGDAYREIFHKVFMQAAAHASDKIKYRPAWMRMVIQSHFKIHGETYYNEAKSLRNQTEQVILFAKAAAVPAPDPVKGMAAARDILTAGMPKKRQPKAEVKPQLNLF